MASNSLWRRSLRLTGVDAGSDGDRIPYDGTAALRQRSRRFLLRILVEGAVGLEQGAERTNAGGMWVGSDRRNYGAR